jgi:hypothetical protein
MSRVFGPVALAGRVPLPPVWWTQNVALGDVLLQCSGCGYQSSVTAGTIFQDTRKPLTLWFRAM